MIDRVKAPRVVIVATKSGCGKTTITSALLYLLNRKIENVRSFKCGPDYIDPMYHQSVLGICSKNLDPFFCDSDLLRASFVDGIGNLNLIEGCMGLYDGIGVSSDASTYAVANCIDAPIILVVDAYGAGYSIVAQIMGYITLDNRKQIKGIILNRISNNYFGKIAPVIEQETGITVVGYVPKLEKQVFSSRHLGLCSVDENNGLEKIKEIAAIIEETVDIEKLINIANQAPEMSGVQQLSDFIKVELKDCTVGVAYDEAFNFYYKDNIKCLEDAGADIVYFSPLHDSLVPEKCSALLIGGGYPENYLEELSSNELMKQSIKTKIEAGMPVVAECGGFMYLNSFIDDFEMVGVFSDKANNMKKSVRFGYVTGELDGLKVKGHEFHHYDVSDPGTEMKMTKVSTQEEYYACKVYKNCFAGFPHFYYYSEPLMINMFEKGYFEK